VGVDLFIFEGAVDMHNVIEQDYLAKVGLAI
jgi:hypothetical protein